MGSRLSGEERRTENKEKFPGLDFEFGGKRKTIASPALAGDPQRGSQKAS